MSRVFIAERNDKYNVNAAELYGEIIYFSATKINPFHTSEAVELFTKSLKRLNFDPSQDFICLTGSSIVVALLLSVAANIKDGETRVLMFDARQGKYKERKLCLNG